MMKKLLSVLLCVCLLSALCAPALAENCYETLCALLGLEESGDLYLGEAYCYEHDVDENISIFYYGNQELLLIAGVNDQGKGEVTYWEKVDYIQAVYVIYKLCSIWDVLQGLLPEGGGLVFGLALDGSEDGIFVSTAEQAALYVSAIESMLAGGEQ